jgi:GNAT superfamily N-acetyltransferase
LIRPAEPADLPAIERIVHDAYEPYVERIGRRPAPMDDDYADKVRGGSTFVAESGGGVVGLVVLVAHPDHLLVENVAVDPRHHGHGVGRALLDFAEAHARALGLAELRLYTNAAMTANLSMYPHVGYVETGRRRERGFERVYFRKRLEP